MPIGKGGELSEAVGRHEDAVRAAAEAGIHIALAGHFHRTYAEAADRMVAHAGGALVIQAGTATRSEEHTSELQSLMRISYAVFCLKKKKKKNSDKNKTKYRIEIIKQLKKLDDEEFTATN